MILLIWNEITENLKIFMIPNDWPSFQCQCLQPPG